MFIRKRRYVDLILQSEFLKEAGIGINVYDKLDEIKAILEKIYEKEMKVEMPKIEVSIPRVTRTTRVDRKKDLVISGKYDVLLLKGSGNIREILIIAKNPDFNIRIVADYFDVINDSFENLMKKSTYTDLYDAYTSDGEYVFAITDINFEASFEFYIEGNVEIKEITTVYSLEKEEVELH